MLLRCIAVEPTPEQRALVRPPVLQNQAYHLECGGEYVALGVEVWAGVTWVDIAENDRTVVGVPLFLFEILDGQLSSRWIARTDEDGSVTFWPDLFYERAFHDRLSNGEPALVERFVELRRELEAEAR